MVYRECWAQGGNDATPVLTVLLLLSWNQISEEDEEGQAEEAEGEPDAQLPTVDCPPLCSPVEGDDVTSSPLSGDGEAVASPFSGGGEAALSPLSDTGGSLFSPFDASPFDAALGGGTHADTAGLMAAVAAKYGITLADSQGGDGDSRQGGDSMEEEGRGGAPEGEGRPDSPVREEVWSPLVDMGATERSLGQEEQEGRGQIRSSPAPSDSPTPDGLPTVSPRDVGVTVEGASPEQPQQEPSSPTVPASPIAGEMGLAIVTEEEEQAPLQAQPLQVQHRSPTNHARAASPRALSPSGSKARPTSPLSVDVRPVASAQEGSPRPVSPVQNPRQASPPARGSPSLKRKGSAVRVSPLLERRQASLQALAAEEAARSQADASSPDMMSFDAAQAQASPRVGELSLAPQAQEAQEALPQAAQANPSVVEAEEEAAPQAHDVSEQAVPQADSPVMPTDTEALWGGATQAVDGLSPPFLAEPLADDLPAFLVEAKESWPRAVSPARAAERVSPHASSPSSKSTKAEEAALPAIGPRPPTAPLEAGQAWPTFMIEEEEAPSPAQPALATVEEEGDDWLRTAALSLSPSDAPVAHLSAPPDASLSGAPDDAEAGAAAPLGTIDTADLLLLEKQLVTGGVTGGVTGAGEPTTPSRAHIYFSPKATKVSQLD